MAKYYFKLVIISYKKYIFSSTTIFLSVVAGLLSHLLFPHSSAANENYHSLNYDDYDLGEVTPVYRLKMVRQQDWSFITLTSIGKQHDCAANLNQTNPQMTIDRYEFAVALQTCLTKIHTFTDREDLSQLLKLATIFEGELAIIKNRLTSVETTVARLEDRQFSPTTKFEGEVLLILGDSNENTSSFLGYEVELDLNTSFTGKDALKIGLEAKKIAELDEVTDTLTTRLSTDGNTDGEVEVKLNYQFPINKQITTIFGTDGVNLDDTGEVLNPLSSSGDGALSRFGRRNPATMRAPGNAGIGIRYDLTEDLLLALGYAVDAGEAADAELGLFKSSYSLFAQFVAEPVDDLEIAVAYVRAYQPDEEVNLMGSTGSEIANEPFGDLATSSDRLGVQFNWEISDGFEIGGWFGYTQASQKSEGDDGATILNGALTLVFPDLFAESNLGGIIIGVPPLVTQHSDSSLIADKTTLHLEALYRLQVNDNLSITPGAFAIINPDTDNSELIWVGVVRTQLRF